VNALPDALADPDQLLEPMPASWRLHIGHKEPCSATWYDSFDWRLFQAGLGLRVEASVEADNWYLLDLKDDTLLAQLKSSQQPGFANELPELLRSRLGPLLEMRTLLPRLHFHGHRQPLAILNKEDKTLVRLELWRGESRLVESRPAIFVHLQGLKGYEKAAARVRRWCERQGLGHLIGQTQPLIWLQDHGQRAGDYSAKLNFDFQADTPAAEAAMEILGFLLWVMRANMQGTSQGLDSEFLHDLRVAVRRTRSALSQIKVFEPEAIAGFREGFGWLGQITGPTRDLDVHLLEFPQYLALLPTEHQEALEPLRARIAERQRLAQAALAEELATTECQGLFNDWHEFLQAQTSGRNWSKRGLQPVSELASGRIWRSYLQVCKDGEAINDQSPAEALHELRKDCKKLRYLLEFFQHLYPQDRMRELIRHTKTMLDTLGRFQDLEVQANSLHSLSEGLFAQGSPGQQAEQLLMEALANEQAKERTLFASRLADLLSQKSVYKKLFANRKEGR
jgi:CHAD domain-containing protein